MTNYNYPDIGASLRQMTEMHDRQIENANRMAGRYDAGEIHQHLMLQVKIFQSALGENEEIGVRLANFGEAAQIHIRAISFKNPNLIEFHGVNPDGHEVTLVQHISQLNFLLIAVKPIEQEPYRIGFMS